jgi:hypothetical protein
MNKQHIGGETIRLGLHNTHGVPAGLVGALSCQGLPRAPWLLKAPDVSAWKCASWCRKWKNFDLECQKVVKGFKRNVAVAPLS